MPLLDLDAPAERTLGRILRRQAQARPEAPYLLSGDERYGYGGVNDLANACAAGFAGLGVGRGDTVAFLMETCVEFVFTTFGVMKLGAVWVPTNVAYKGEWLRANLEDSRARVLVADVGLLPRVAELGGRLGLEHVVVRGEGEVPDLGVPVTRLDDLFALHAGEPVDPGVGMADTAAVLWTSGTTGRSKGVMQSHSAWVRGAVSGAKTSGTRDGDIMYCCLPMYNSAAWVANVYRALVAGLPVAIDPEFSASRFWDRCRHYDATQIFTLGAMHMFLWQAPEAAGDKAHSVRHASMIPLPDALIDGFKERFGLATIDQGFGQSEAMGLLHREDDGTRWKPNSLGRPLPGMEIALLDEDDRPVASGGVGEFCVRPAEPFVLFNGYFNAPQATVDAFRNLWYHTGDLGRQDEDGDYFFVDRKSDFIRFKARNISSFEVEAAVAAHPKVSACAAFGVATAALESEAELMVAVVVAPGEALEPELLARFVNDTAPYFFVPRYIDMVDDLPRTPTGRVQKFKLRERGVTRATWDAEASGFVVSRS
jgi:crotonobetaine/carnitine-CoA ligase